MGSLPWHWMTTGKCCQGSGQSNHHPCDSRKGRSCQMGRKGLFFYSSVFPSFPFSPFTFVFWLGLSFLLILSVSFTRCQKKRTFAILSISPLTFPVFLPPSPTTIIGCLLLSSFTLILPLHPQLLPVHLYLHGSASPF